MKTTSLYALPDLRSLTSVEAVQAELRRHGEHLADLIGGAAIARVDAEKLLNSPTAKPDEIAQATARRDHAARQVELLRPLEDQLLERLDKLHRQEALAAWQRSADRYYGTLKELGAAAAKADELLQRAFRELNESRMLLGRTGGQVAMPEPPSPHMASVSNIQTFCASVAERQADPIVVAFPVAAQRHTVQFLAAWGTYTSGMAADFDAVTAWRLVDANLAVFTGRPPRRPAAKPVTLMKEAAE